MLLNDYYFYIEHHFHLYFYFLLVVSPNVLRQIKALDTGRKLNVHKTFRRRPRRLLNVLCTFNLRPVYTGIYKKLCRQKVTKLSASHEIFY